MKLYMKLYAKFYVVRPYEDYTVEKLCGREALHRGGSLRKLRFHLRVMYAIV